MTFFSSKFNKNKLKPRKGKAFECFRSTITVCPSCLSSLKIDKTGKYVCSGDKLSLWKDQFKLFEKMNKEDREIFLRTLDNKDKFLELYNKRDRLECDYSANMVELVPQKSIEIPDPLVVSKIERNLKRTLTEKELKEGYTFYTDGNNFYTDFNFNYNLQPFKIPRIKFPEEV